MAHYSWTCTQVRSSPPLPSSPPGLPWVTVQPAAITLDSSLSLLYPVLLLSCWSFIGFFESVACCPSLFWENLQNCLPCSLSSPLLLKFHPSGPSPLFPVPTFLSLRTGLSDEFLWFIFQLSESLFRSLDASKLFDLKEFQVPYFFFNFIRFSF